MERERDRERGRDRARVMEIVSERVRMESER